MASVWARKLTVALFIGALACIAQTWAATPDPYDYTPNRHALAYSPSVTITGNPGQFLQFLYNRGEGQVNLLAEWQRMFDPAHIAKLPGFKGYNKTRVTFMTYELRSREIRNLIKDLLEKGVNVRVIVDATPIQLLDKPLSEAELKKLTPSQRRYYTKAYDLDEDGKVTEKDIQTLNEKRFLTAEIWKELRGFKTTYKEKLELITPPFELVPEMDHFAYPHLTHFKWSGTEFENGKNEWTPAEALIGSANLTDSCLDKRVSRSEPNIKKYLGNKPYTFTNGSEGNIQFVSRITGAEALLATKGPIEEWIALYKQGKNFDTSKPIDRFWPRVVFQGKDGSTIGVLQAFFSEGTKVEGRNAIDPTYAIMNTLSQAKEVKVIYESQFVFSHKAYARHLRHHIAQDKLEDLFIMVDGAFDAEEFSALSDLLFAPGLTNAPGVLATKAIQNYYPLPETLDWPQKVFGFDGHSGIFGSKAGDKLHAKLSYFEYLDDKDVRHYLVAWGSANKSANAGRLNAEGLYTFETTDVEMVKPIKLFFDGLKKEQRKFAFSERYLEFRFLEMMNPDPAVFNAEYFKLFSAYLSKPNNTPLSKLIQPLKQAGAKTIYGENALNILEWFDKYSGKKLNWEEFYVALFTAHPKQTLEPGFVTALQKRWLGENPSPSAVPAFSKMIKNLKSFEKEAVRPPTTVQEILNNCRPHLVRLNSAPREGGAAK